MGAARIAILLSGATLSFACASSTAPTALRSNSAPATVSTTTDVDDVDTSEVETTGVDTTGVDTSGDVTVPDVTVPVTLPPVTLPPVTLPPTSPPTTLDPGAYEAAVEHWSQACAATVAGLTALPLDVAASLGELAKLVSDLDAAATAAPPTGRADDPVAPVRELLLSAGSSLTAAAIAFASGDAAEVEARRDEARTRLDDAIAALRAFGATC